MRIGNVQRRKDRFVISLVLLCYLWLATPLLAQDEITFTAAVDRSVLSTTDTLQLQLTLTGSVEAAMQPQLPGLLEFVVLGSSQSSQFQLINGVTSAQIVFTYQLRPTQTGSLTIPSIPIDVGGQTLQTEPITVEVVQGAVAPPAQPNEPTPPASQSSGENADLIVEAIVDNPVPFVGEPIRYQFHFYQAVQLLRQPQLDLPEFTGFLRNELSPTTQSNTVRNGRSYLVTEVQQVLFPLQADTLTIDTASLTVPGDLFSRAVALSTEPVTVAVQPLPADAPEGFTGTVGEFTITAWVEPEAGRVNEPMTLFVHVTGTGHPDLIPDPTTRFNAMGAQNGWRVFDPTITVNPAVEADVEPSAFPVVEKQFSRPLLPTRAGDLVIPAFSLAYFDPTPNTGGYRQISTEPLTITIAPTVDVAAEALPVGERTEITRLATDIRHIKSAPIALRAGHSQLLTDPLYWAGWFLPAMMITGVLLWERRQRFRAQNADKVRAAQAYRLAKRRLQQARIEAKQDVKQGYRTVASALHGYLADRFRLPTAAPTRTEITRILGTATVDKETVTRLITCLDWADAGRFAPGTTSRTVIELIDETAQILGTVERKAQK